MTYAEIKDLLSNGFNPEQITMLTTSGTNPSVPDVQAGPDPITVPAVMDSPVEGTADNNETAVPDTEESAETAPDQLEEIRQQLRTLQKENEQLRKQIQTNNIRDRTMETVDAPDAAVILGEVIRPTFHNSAELSH